MTEPTKEQDPQELADVQVQPQAAAGAEEAPAPPAAPPPFPSWRDHFAAAVIWPGREAAPREAVRVPLDPIHPHESRTAPREPSPVAAAVGAAAEDAVRLAREVAEMSQEERTARMQRLAAGMRPISSDAEDIVVRALDFGASGLSRLADRIERRRRIASGLPASRRRND